LVAAAQACLTQFFAPARSAALPNLLPVAKLAAANSAVAAGSELALLVGPALGGLIYATAGLRLAVALDAGSYLVSAATISCLRALDTRDSRTENAENGGRRRVLTDLYAGLMITWRSPALRALLAASVLLFVGGGQLAVLIVPLARNRLHASGREYGLVLSAQAVGGLAGAAVAARAIRPFATPRVPIGASLLAMAGAVAALGMTTRWWAAALCLAVAGVPTTISGVATNTVLQTVPPDDQRGRIGGLYGAAVALGVIIGSPLAGVLVARSGIPVSIEITALVFAASGILTIVAFPGR